MNRYYAVKNKDNLARKNSASGAFFSVLAEFVLDQGGSVYGAALLEDAVNANIKVSHFPTLC